MDSTTFSLDNLNIQAFLSGNEDRLVYVLSYGPLQADEIIPMAEAHNADIIVISGMDWDDDLTPWTSPGVPAGSPNFKGKGAEFYKRLVKEVLPAVEKKFGIENPERTLAGVSLSGLFTLWAWVAYETPFTNIVSISGSFWYPGFTEWLAKRRIANMPGIAYFSLGIDEQSSKVKAFNSVALRTQEVMAILKARGVKAFFKWTAGNHYAPIAPRLEAALSEIYPILV